MRFGSHAVTFVATTMRHPCFFVIDLLAELLREAVNQAVHAIGASDPAQGPAGAALQRVLAASWQQVPRHAQLTEAIGRILESERQNSTPPWSSACPSW
jgi:hypothetical protein